MLLRQKHDLAQEDWKQAKTRLTLQYQKAVAENQFYRSFIRFFPFETEISSRSGALSGLSAAIKDVVAVAGAPLSLGLPHPIQVSQSAAVVDSLRGRGAALFGATELDPLCLDHWGIGTQGKIRNPVDTECSPLGSSGGSAVAVARNQVDFALGTDFGGSIRLPAAACGICSFRAAPGFIDSKGTFLLSTSLDALGYLAPALDDISFLLESLHDVPAPSTERPEFYIPNDEDLNLLSEPARGEFDAICDFLSSAYALHSLESQISFAQALRARKVIAVEEAAKQIRQLRIATESLPITARAVISYDSNLEVPEKAAARCLAQELENKLSRMLSGSKLLLTPTLPRNVPRWTEIEEGKDFMPALNLFLALVNICGLTAITFPLSRALRSAPYSLQLIGPPGTEGSVVEAAKSVEKHLKSLIATRS